MGISPESEIGQVLKKSQANIEETQNLNIKYSQALQEFTQAVTIRDGAAESVAREKLHVIHDLLLDTYGVSAYCEKRIRELRR